MRIIAPLLALAFVCAPLCAEEEDHSLGDIAGPGIELKTYDHAFAGAIKDFVAWGFLDEAEGRSELVMRKYGAVVKTVFKRQADKRFGGVVESGEGASARRTPVFMVKAEPKEKRFVLEIGGEEITVEVAPERMDGHHYVDPTYSTTLGGVAVSYRMDGHACMGMSIHFAMMILGAYAH